MSRNREDWVSTDMTFEKFQVMKAERIRFRLEATDDAIRLPRYLGSTLRGSVAWGLRKTACALERQECQTCLLKERCAYSYLFETPLPSDAEVLRSYGQIPRPIVIEPPMPRTERWNSGDELAFSVVLVGRALEYVPFLVAATDTAAKHGLGKDRRRFALKRVELPASGNKQLWPVTDGNGISPIAGRPVFDASLHNEQDELSLNFMTTTRILVDGKVTIPPTFRTFARALLSRVSSLAAFHCDIDATIDAKALLDDAAAVTEVQSDLAPSKTVRWSNRQDRKIEMHGFTGTITWKGTGIGPMMPFIRAGEIFHVGKGTVFGLGKFNVLN